MMGVYGVGSEQVSFLPLLSRQESCPNVLRSRYISGCKILIGEGNNSSIDLRSRIKISDDPRFKLQRLYVL